MKNTNFSLIDQLGIPSYERRFEDINLNHVFSNEEIEMYSVKKIMREYVNKGHTILLSTHMLDMAERFCDDVILINEGKVVSNGTESIENILRRYGSLEKYYITKALPSQ